MCHVHQISLQVGGNINCISLHERLQLTWTLNMTAPRPMATFTLCGRLETNQYMAFGLSGSSNSINMVGGDVTVAWVDSEPHAEDYFLDSRRTVCTINAWYIKDLTFHVMVL